MSEDTQSQEHTKFIDEFNKLSTENLKTYEQENRKRINDADIEVRLAFDKKWKKLVGTSYFVPVTSATEKQAPGDAKRTDPASNNYQGFWEVLFSSKGSPNDPDDVTLTLNGECLQIQRNVPVIIPGPFLEVCDHGVYPVYHQEPGKDRKIVGSVKFFPYTTMRQASEEEYKKMKASGDRITKDAREKQEKA